MDTLVEQGVVVNLTDVFPMEKFKPSQQRAAKLIDEMDMPLEDKRDIFVYYLFTHSSKKKVKEMAKEFPNISERQFISSQRRVIEDERLEASWNKFQDKLVQQAQPSIGKH